MIKEDLNSGSESDLPDLRTALQEFANPEDLRPDNKPVYKINERGLQRTCFRRGDFTPSGKSEIANLLRAYEKGSDSALSTIEAMLEGLPVCIKMEINEAPIDKWGRMITQIILVSRGDIFETLKPSLPA